MNSWAQVVFPEAYHSTHRKWNCSNGEVGASTALFAGGSRLGMPSGFLLLLPGRASKFFTWLVKCRTLFKEDHRRGSGLLCRVESNLSLAFLSKLPLIGPEIIKDIGHCCRQLWLNNGKKKDLKWVGTFLFLRTLWAFLKAHDLLGSVGWPADEKACFPSLKETLRSLCPFPCL